MFRDKKKKQTPKKAQKGTNKTPTKPGSAAKKTPLQEYNSSLVDFQIFLEFRKLKSQNIRGVYVVPSTKNLRKWYGVIFLRTGKYRNGIFKFVIFLPGYPNRMPQVVFTSKIFNPLINERGELDLSVQFPVWEKDNHSIAMLLDYIKTVFYNPRWWNTRSEHEPFNRAAAETWMHNRDIFDKKCQQCVELSKKAKYEYDPESPLKFTQPKHNHSILWNRILNSEEEIREPGFSFAEWFSDGVRNLVAYIPTLSRKRQNEALGLTPREQKNPPTPDKTTPLPSPSPSLLDTSLESNTDDPTSRELDLDQDLTIDAEEAIPSSGTQ